MATARKDELFKTLLRELSPYAVVVLPNGELSITAGDAPQIEIIVESRMGHKTVTRLRGLESFGIGKIKKKKKKKSLVLTECSQQQNPNPNTNVTVIYCALVCPSVCLSPDLNGFTKECQKKFACSASVSVIAGMLKEKEVNIQVRTTHIIYIYSLRCD